MNSRPYSTPPPGRTSWWRKLTAFGAALALFGGTASAQCTNSSQYPSGTITAPATLNQTTTISTCSFAGEYSVVGSVVSGIQYRFTSTSGYITVRTGAFNGAVVGFGASPLTIVAPSAANLYPHWNINAACGTQSSCYTTTIQNLGSSSACSGVPAPGNTTGPTGACTGVAINLGLQNVTSGTGVSYQWQMDTGGGFANFGTNASTQSVTQSVSTTYKCIVTCAGNSTPSNPLVVPMNTFINCYCTPTSTNGCLSGDHITNVTFGTINNSSGTCLSSSYSDYTFVAPATIGQTANVPLSCTINNGGTEYGGAWIDYDHSGTFDAAEFILLNGGLGQGGGVFSGVAAVPLTAQLGLTRLRVRSSYNAALVPATGACATVSYSECEDYLVNITTPPSCISPLVTNSNVQAHTADINWSCGGCTGTYYVEYGLNGFTPGTGAAAGVGGTIWTGAAVAGGPVTITGLASTTAYAVYVRQDCGGGNFSVNSLTSFSTGLDCSTAPVVACSTPTTFTAPSGTGSWFLGSTFCSPPGTGAGPFCTPGKETVFQFTATNAGSYVLNVTATSSSGYIDYFFKPVGACDQTGWTYINDVFSPETATFTISTPGVYLLVADPEGTGGGTQTFNIECPLPCATPQFPFAQNVTSTGAQIAWTCTSCTGNSFTVEYGPPGFAHGTGTTVTSATSPATIPPGSLTPTTAYQAYVQQDCGNVGDGLSNWSAVVSFTTLAPPPVNDDCVNAIAVNCGDLVTGTNVAATNDGVPSQASGGETTVDNGVWYVYTASAAGEQVTASLCTGTSFDSRIHIFQGSCGSLVGIAGADDVCGVQSTITWNALPLTTYYIAVEGYGLASGTFNMSMTCGPLCNPFVTNDICANRQVITMGPNCIPFGGNLSCATNSAGNNPACIGGFNPYPDAYYEFVATAPDAFVTLTGGSNLYFMLYNNTCVTTPGTEVYCSGAVTSGSPTLVTGLTNGNTYVLRVMQLQASASTFTLCVQKIDVSDDPCTAIPLVCNDQRFGRTVGRLNNIPSGACPFNGAASTGGVNYFTYTALADEDVTFSTCGLSTFDSRISVFEGTCTSLSCNVMSDNAPGCPSSSSTAQVRAQEGTTYTIMVHGAGAAEGNYQMVVFCEPYCSGFENNDRCANAAPITTWTEGDPDAVLSSETLVCSYLDGPTSCSGASNVQGVWYTLTTNSNNTDYDVYLASTTQNAAYTAPAVSMALFSGGCSNTGASGELICVASAGGSTQLPPLAPSTTYRMLVYNAGGLQEGTFGLQVTHPGYNDGGITAILTPNGTVCDQRFQPQVTLTNYGEAPLSSARIVSRIDGGIVQTYDWSGAAIPTGSSSTITLPLVTSPFGLHDYTAEVLLANGAPDDLAINSGTTVSYDATGQTVRVTVQTDANPGQTSWTIFDPFFFPVASSGALTANSPNTSSACLATTFGSCFYFFMFDAANDGIVNGKWSLSDTQGRIILGDNGAYTAQSPSLTPASPIYFAHEFCLPLGPSPIQAAECNVFNNYLNNKVYTTAVAGVVNYQFEFSDPNAGFYRRISLPRNWVKFGEMVSTPLVYGTTYFCRARADQGASGFGDDFYGAGCEMALAPSQPICTELISTPGSTLSCGVTKTFGGSAKIWAQPVTYATQYKFSFVGMIDPDGPNPLPTDTIGVDGVNDPPVMGTRNILRTSYVCPLNWATYTLVSGQTYQVSVDVFIGGAWSGFCGAVCPVTILNPPGAMQLQDGGAHSSDVVLNGSNVSMWPNPARDGRVNLMIGGIADETQMITVDIYDTFGKRVMAQQFENSGAMFNRVLDLDGSMAAGTYVVKIAVNNEIHVERLTIVR